MERETVDTTQSNMDTTVTMARHMKTYQEDENVTVKKKHKCSSDYLKFGFLWQENSEDPKP